MGNWRKNRFASRSSYLPVASLSNNFINSYSTWIHLIRRNAMVNASRFLSTNPTSSFSKSQKEQPDYGRNYQHSAENSESRTIPKPYFFHGHRRPSQNRPVVYGGSISNRQSEKGKPPRVTEFKQFDIHKWDPSSPPPPPLERGSESESHTQTHKHQQLSLSVSQGLSPIARFILDAFRKNNNRWGPPVVTELNKLRRVTPNLVEEVLKVQNLPIIATKFFNWAGKQKGYRHNFGCYNALAYCLNRNGHYRAADQLPELMESQGKPPSEKQFEILIRMHADANRGLRIHYVYDKMKKFGVKPRVFLYNRIMDGLIKTGYLDLALSVYDDFQGDGLVEENITFMILIKGLCKAGRTDEMLNLLKKMRQNLCKPDIFAYTAMVKSLVSEKNLNGCFLVWEEMKRDGIEPDVMAYSTMVLGMCKENMVDKGYELFKEMKNKPILIDRSIYAALIHGYVSDKKIGLAFDLLKDLLDSGYRADLDIYNSIIKGLCDSKHVDKAYKLFQIAIQEELEPDFATLNHVLKCYAETKRMEEFINSLEQMRKLGFNVIDGLSSFFSYIIENEEQNSISLALQVFEDIKTKGYIDISFYNILMDCLYEKGEIKKTLDLFNEVKSSNMVLDSLTYSIAVKCYVENDEIEQGCFCHNKIIEMSCIPTISAYRCLVRGLCKKGEIDAGMMLVRDCLFNVTNGPIEFKYALTIVHVCCCNKTVGEKMVVEKVVEVLDEMMLEKTVDEVVLCCGVIFGMCEYGRVDEGIKVFEKLKERNVLSEAEVIVYEEMLVEHMKKKTADLVVSGLKFFGLESKLRAKGSRLVSS